MSGPGKAETTARIKTAFWELYETHALSEISVKQITNRAGYNRGTFYLYYDNIREVLDQIEDDIIASMLKDRDTESMLSFLLMRRSLGEELESFAKIFEGHQRYLVVLFGENGDPMFARKLKDAIKAELLPTMVGITDTSPEAVDYALEYHLSGAIGLLTYLFGSGARELDGEALLDAFAIMRVVTAAATIR